jgi:hypothetical protein
MFEAFSIQGCHLSTLRSTESVFHSLCTTKAPFQILCVHFSTQTQMTVMRNDSAHDLARLDVANLYCEMHFQ